MFYDFTAKTLRGEEVSMRDFADKVVLIVNTASNCGFTPQFTELETLYKKYKDDGLVILGFPCNQFGNQEPGDADAINEVCSINYGVTFPMFAKIEVNGKNAHPLFKWLKHELGGSLGDAIKWNFTKFLLGRNGQPIRRYAPITPPNEIEPDIISMLNS
ncbi:glutathione peroxidase [Pseudaquidulcibacter saccharophilus]|uniref:glutathione peroxidase n=1 Tax=Pseudaquidulcibacter saccharophilus TaxID=2831900 RepID=UPI001EFF00BB|nr:glutathione peroxidase [Pseudaquidulcibacter saccharophilus]